MRNFEDVFGIMTKRTVWSEARRRLRSVVSYLRYDIHQGFYGLFYWAPFAWRWRPWDYAYALDALELHLVKLEDCMRNGSGANGPSEADEIKVAIQLIHRLREDNYMFVEGYRQELMNKSDGRVHIDASNQDWESLMTLLKRKMRRWWD